MDKTYNPKNIEQRWYSTWEARGYFAPDMNAQGDNPYCIMIPPPNVTGTLHMGHAFQDTIMDALTRFHRMRGEKTLWQPGTDHAGIATQMVVERLINAEGKTRHDYGREAFLDKVWQWKEQSGGAITQQLRRMGASLDWENERFTMDDGLSDAVQDVFIQLYDEGLIYRGKRLVNWDPVLHTAVSDLEVLSEEEQGFMWHMKYPLSNGDGFLVVATTRPETMLGDCAVAINPKDERYQHLLGEMLDLPLTGRQIPVIADDHVDPDFGTGCVKVTPAHDFNDYQVWQRHKKEAAIASQPHGGLINLFNHNAAIRENEEEEDHLIPSAYIGLDRYDARKQMVADLENLGLMGDIKDHKLMVPRGDRSGSVIEPYLTDQWYVHTAPLAEPAIKAVKQGDIKFVPDNWKNTYFEWMNNIEDWCISRQIWWGHRIPAWYDDEGNIYVGRSEKEVREKHHLPDDLVIAQDEDVLDTWFSSALWPFSTLGWPDNTQRLETFYPTSVLVTGFDIIFFWVARMIMMGIKFTGKVPFREVYIHGLVRDAEGQKMSKSKGNVLDPIDVIDGISLDDLLAKRTQGMMQPHLAKKIEKQTRKSLPNGISGYGTDALRFTFASQASRGRDVVLSMERIEGNRNFCNKIWNAAQYVLMNAEGKDCGQTGQEVVLTKADEWILTRLQETKTSVTDSIIQYRFDHAAQALYDFTWNAYCAWYLELTKPVLHDEYASEALQRGTRQTLVQVLEQVLCLLHPIMPFISEEIWQKLAPLAGKTGETIMHQPYPVADESYRVSSAVTEMAWVQTFILGVRQIKGEMNIPPKKALPVFLVNASNEDQQRLNDYRGYLDALAKLESITILTEGDDVPESATALVGEMEVLIPMAGLIDKDAELARLSKEIAKLSADCERLDKKLSNENFVSRAPAAVVEKEKMKLNDQQMALAKLQTQLVKIESL